MLLRVILTIVGATVIFTASAYAGCKTCGPNAPVSMAPVAVDAGMVHGGHHVHGGMAMSGFAMGSGAGSAFSGMEPFRGYRPDHTPYAGGHVPNIAPPAGTIGRTYQLPTAPVPAEMHPRASVLKVLADGATEVELVSTNQMRTEDLVEGYKDPDTGVWVFKTEPLIPGNVQIYRVRAKYGDGMSHRDRYVRLIMGRVSALTF